MTVNPQTPAQAASAVHLTSATEKIDDFESAGGSAKVAEILRTLVAAIGAADSVP